jgi:TIR domain
MATSQISVFLSHSSADHTLAERLARLFQKALRLPADKIRCSSADGHRLGGGDVTDETLRQEVSEADTFVGLITPASVRSQYVLFELGARWGCGRRLRPLLAGGTVAGSLKPPLANLMSLSAGNEAQIMQLITELAGELVVQYEAPHALMPDIHVVANLSRAKYLDSSVAREVCRKWAEDDDPPERGDLQLLPAFLDSEDEILAFVGTKDYTADAGIAITPSGIAWKNPSDAKINRIGWVELAETRILASSDDDQVAIGRALRIDLSRASYNAGAVADLLRELVRRGYRTP